MITFKTDFTKKQKMKFVTVGVLSASFQTYQSRSFSLTDELLLEDFGNYRFLVAGHVQVQNQQDDEMLEETLEAMEVLGFNEEERIGI